MATYKDLTKQLEDTDLKIKEINKIK